MQCHTRYKGNKQRSCTDRTLKLSRHGWNWQKTGEEILFTEVKVYTNASLIAFECGESLGATGGDVSGSQGNPTGPQAFLYLRYSKFTDILIYVQNVSEIKCYQIHSNSCSYKNSIL